MKIQQKETLNKLLKIITAHLDDDRIVEGSISFSLNNENDPWEYKVECDIDLINFPHIIGFSENDEEGRFKITQKNNSLSFSC